MTFSDSIPRSSTIFTAAFLLSPASNGSDTVPWKMAVAEHLRFAVARAPAARNRPRMQAQVGVLRLRFPRLGRHQAEQDFS